MSSPCSGQRLRRRASTPSLLCLVAFVVGSTVVTVIKWRRTSTSSADTKYRSWTCLCSVETHWLPRPSACRATYPKMEKNLRGRAALLKEEMELSETVARESLIHTDTAIRTMKKTSARFENEAAKCKITVETCEERRERAEAELVEQRRLTKLWEKRARERGWSNNSRK